MTTPTDKPKTDKPKTDATPAPTADTTPAVAGTVKLACPPHVSKFVWNGFEITPKGTDIPADQVQEAKKAGLRSRCALREV